MGALASDALADGRYAFLHEGMPPARPFEYQVLAVRSVDDPIDASGAARRAAPQDREPALGDPRLSCACPATAGRDKLLRWAKSQSVPVITIPGADHFFSRRLPELARFVCTHLSVITSGHQ